MQKELLFWVIEKYHFFLILNRIIKELVDSCLEYLNISLIIYSLFVDILAIIKKKNKGGATTSMLIDFKFYTSFFANFKERVEMSGQKLRNP